MTLMRIDMIADGEKTVMFLHRFPGEERWSTVTQPELNRLYKAIKTGSMHERELEKGVKIFYTSDD